MSLEKITQDYMVMYHTTPRNGKEPSGFLRIANPRPEGTTFQFVASASATAAEPPGTAAAAAASLEPELSQCASCDAG